MLVLNLLKYVFKSAPLFHDFESPILYLSDAIVIKVVNDIQAHIHMSLYLLQTLFMVK